MSRAPVLLPTVLEPAGPRWSPEVHAAYLRASRSYWWFRGRERILQAVGAEVLRGTRGIVMDVGSGPGGPAHAVFPDSRLVAVDLSPVPLEAYAEATDRVMADVGALPCRAASLEAVCAFDVLEHLDDDRAALREWRRALKPGGWLVMTVPAYAALWSPHDALNGHRRRYRARTMRRLLEAEGFAVERMTYFNTLLLPAVALVRWVQRLAPARRAPAAEPPSEFGLALPGWMAWCCERVFRLEARWLRRAALPFGVSLCALARAGGPAPSTNKER